MVNKFNRVWSNQTNLGKIFGLSAVAIGKILIEHGLKDHKSGQATLEAIEGGYAKSTPLKSGTPFFMWNLNKVKNLIGKKHAPLSQVEYWVNEVKKVILESERLLEEGRDKLACILMDHAYEEVPQKIRAEVRRKIEIMEVRNLQSN